ncbi:RING finger protein 17-like isoform X1 [Apostichopus japonicus]|uniref:RING finger protein 17-like isoform X1 n=1 Tax=Stichopus japonicus TaxID=307972 RepID=UPI003AB4E4A0
MSTVHSPPKCPKCLRNYSFSHAGLQPRILSCKHSLCKQCVIKSLRNKNDGLSCPQCQVFTAVIKGDKNLQSLPVNLFLVGLSCTTVKQQINPFDHQLEFKAKSKPGGANYQPTELKGGRPPCTSCQQGPADCLCQHCDIHLCNLCFITIHKTQSGNTHSKIPLLTDKVYGCPTHENMPREFFCEDDGTPICAKCGLTGEHKGHNILHIQEKNSEIHKDLEPAVASAKTTLKRLYYTKEAVDVEEKQLSKVKEKAVEEVDESFAQFYADLQLQHLAMKEAVRTANDSQLENLSCIKNNLARNICRLTTVIEDVLPGLEDKTKVPSNLTEIISILREASSLPWHLVREKEGETMSKFIPGEMQLSSKVEVNPSSFHSLKTSAELPEDFKEPTIDDDILKHCPLFGKKEQKKKKPIGPDHIRILQKEGILPADLAEIKDKVKPRPALDLKKISKKQNVRVVHIRSPGCFYVHRQGDLPRLEKTMKSLSSICESITDFSKCIPDTIEAGTKCCCKFDDDQWYRAMVKTVPDEVAGVLSMASPQDLLQADDKDEMKVEVVYIDYGNTQWVPVDKLVRLKPKFEKEPPFAITCALYDIIPPNKKPKWPRESAEAFATMVAAQDVTLKMSYHGEVDDILQVDLHNSPNSSAVDDAPVSIRDALIFLELASFINDTPSPLTPKSPVPPRKYLPPELPCEGESIVATICNIYDPHHFWVQETGVMEVSLYRLMEELQQAYRKRTTIEWTIMCPQLDMICVAKYASDKKWYRAQVIGLPGKQQIEVLYIDYGNTATVPYSQIRKITEKFLKLPVMAIPCKLTDVAPKVPEEGWSAEAATCFSEIISFKPVELHVYNDQDDFISVVAFEIKNEERINLNALLVQSGHVKSSGPASFAPDMLRPSISASPSSIVQSSLSPSRQSVPTSTRKKTMYTAVHVSNVESPSCIYLQLATASKDGLDSLLEAMTLHYKDTEAVMDHEWSPEDPCAALLVREGVWCRGQIVSFLPENNLVVLFTDYGNSEILTLKNIRVLEEKFGEEQPFAICCHLTGVLPAGGQEWTQTSVQFLKDKLNDLDCYICQKGDKLDGSLPVDLLYELTGQEMIDRNTPDELDSISELLIKEGLALRDRRKNTSMSKKSSSKNDGVTPFVTPSGLKTIDHSLEKVSTISPSRDEVSLTHQRKVSSPMREDNIYTDQNKSASKGDKSIYTDLKKTSPKGDNSIQTDLKKTSPQGDKSTHRDQKKTPSPKKDNSIQGSPLSQNHHSVINDSGDSGIVNPDHGPESSPEQGSSVDRVPGSSLDRVLGRSVDRVQGSSVDRLPMMVKDSEVNKTASDDQGLHSRDLTGGTRESPYNAIITGDNLEEDNQEEVSAESQKQFETLTSQKSEDGVNTDSEHKVHGTPINNSVDKSGGAQFMDQKEGPSGITETKLVEYLPPILPDQKESIIAVSFVSQEGLIYGLEVEKLNILQEMMDELQVFCQKGSGSHHPSPLRLNQAVCAKFNLDNKWYRASVSQVYGESAEVVYIDFGNSEVVPLKDIDFRPFRVNLPQQSLCCKLHGITTLSSEKMFILAQMVTEQTCSIIIKNSPAVGEPMDVDMCLPTGENVPQLLVLEGLVSSTHPQPQQKKENTLPEAEIFDEDDLDFMDAAECNRISLSPQCPPGLKTSPPEDGVSLPSKFQQLQFPLNWKEFLAEVPCIETPDLVYLQYSTTFRDGPYQDHDLMLLYDQFVKLHAELNKLALSLPEVSHPKPGMPCLTYYNTDKQWYRGEILSVQESTNILCTVRFVDYGTVENVPLNKLCQLPEKYLELPTQCRLCKIEGLKAPSQIPPNFPISENSNWPVASSNAMVQLIKNKIFLATILEDGLVPIISLYSCQFVNGGIQRGVPMFLSLIETGLADVGVGFSDYSSNR